MAEGGGGGPELSEISKEPQSHNLDFLKQWEIRKTFVRPESKYERLIERSDIVRFEREKLRDLLIEARQKGISGEISKEGLKELGIEVNGFTRKLDLLTRKMPMVNTNLETLPGETQFIKVNIPGLPEAGVPALGEIGIRGAILDLRSEEEKLKEPHPVPLVVFTGWSADFKSLAAVELLAAASGRVVISVSMPEHYTTVKPKNWGNWVNKWVKAGQKDSQISPFWGHAQIMSEVLKKMKEQNKDKPGMDFNKIDVTGYSAGGALDLALADYLTAHPDPALVVRDVYAFNPIGFYADKSRNMVWNFIKAGFKGSQIEQEKRRTFVVQRLSSWGGDFFMKGGFRVVRDIFSKMLFEPERLAKMQVSGKIKVFPGEKDPVIDSKKVKQSVDAANQNRIDKPLIEFVKVQNGGHTMLVGAVPYFVNIMNQRQDVPTEIDYEKLPKSHADVLREKYFEQAA